MCLQFVITVNHQMLTICNACYVYTDRFVHKTLLSHDTNMLNSDKYNIPKFILQSESLYSVFANIHSLFEIVILSTMKQTFVQNNF